MMQADHEKFSKLLSKESSVSNPSFRVYYGVASGSVPFMWESQPGTPKHGRGAMSGGCASLLPPLTPPPSYFSAARSKSKSKSNLINSILPKLNYWRSTSKNIRTPAAPPSMISFSSSSTWSSSSFSPVSSSSHRGGRLSFSSMGEEYDSEDGSPTSILCFGMRQGSGGGGGGVRGCYSMKNALMSIVGQGSSHVSTAAVRS